MTLKKASEIFRAQIAEMLRDVRIVCGSSQHIPYNRGKVDVRWTLRWEPVPVQLDASAIFHEGLSEREWRLRCRTAIDCAERAARFELEDCHREPWPADHQVRA